MVPNVCRARRDLFHVLTLLLWDQDLRSPSLPIEFGFETAYFPRTSVVFMQSISICTARMCCNKIVDLCRQLRVYNSPLHVMSGA